MCFFPFMMTLSLTSSEGRVRPKSVLASADVTLALSKGACVVTVLRSVSGQAAAMGAGVFFSQDKVVVNFVCNLLFKRADMHWLLGQGCWTTGA